MNVKDRLTASAHARKEILIRRMSEAMKSELPGKAKMVDAIQADIDQNDKLFQVIGEMGDEDATMWLNIMDSIGAMALLYEASCKHRPLQKPDGWDMGMLMRDAGNQTSLDQRFAICAVCRSVYFTGEILR